MDSGFFNYKGRPLARCKDRIFYGDPSNSKIIFIHIDEFSDGNGIPIKLSIGLVNSLAASTGSIFKPIKYSVKNSLFESLDLASAWLDRASNGDSVRK